MLLRLIDRKVLNEGEPFYVGDSEFRLELPDDPRERARDLPVDDETIDTVLAEFIARAELELRRIFAFEAPRALGIRGAVAILFFSCLLARNS